MSESSITKDKRVSPETIFSVYGETYVLRGTLDVLRKLQNRFNIDVTEIQTTIIESNFDTLADIYVIATGFDDKDLFAGWILDEFGIDEAKFLVLEWLVAAISPQKKRMQNVETVKKAIQKMRDSLGIFTENFASDI